MADRPVRLPLRIPLRRHNMSILSSFIDFFTPVLIWLVLHMEVLLMSLFVFILIWAFYRST